MNSKNNVVSLKPYRNNDSTTEALISTIGSLQILKYELSMVKTSQELLDEIDQEIARVTERIREKLIKAA
jgi:hypothetical protein